MLLELPSTRDESWRWSDLSALPEIAARTPTGTVPEALPWIDGASEGPRLLFVDGELDKSRSRIAGVEVVELSLVTRHPLGGYATGRRGWHLALGPQQASDIQIIYAGSGGASHVPGSVVMDEDTAASLTETYIGGGWSNRLTQYSLARSARLKRAVRFLREDGFASVTDEAEVGPGASFVTTFLSAGHGDSRFDGRVNLWGEAGFAEVGGALLARGRQRHDVNLAVRHEAVGGMSRQVWRSVADDRSTCSVAARVEVARGAQKTDGEQSLKGLLLARTATINAKPELEIFADDVKCAHGATVGELNRDALFYLASRGVPQVEAKALLTQAFVADAIDRIGQEEVRDAFHADALSWLGSSPSPISGEGGARREAMGG
jgi:Fe-S cluster assembly protein SufD